MKKFMPVILCVVIGVVMGVFIFRQYDYNEIEKVSASALNPIYAVQMAVYAEKENLENISIKHTYEVIDNKYYVYLGFTANKNNIEKLKKYFKDYEIYVKQIEVNNKFFNTLNEYDLLLDEATTDDSIKIIVETVLAKFEEEAVDDKNQRTNS